MQNSKEIFHLIPYFRNPDHKVVLVLAKDADGNADTIQGRHPGGENFFKSILRTMEERLGVDSFHSAVALGQDVSKSSWYLIQPTDEEIGRLKNKPEMVYVHPDDAIQLLNPEQQPAFESLVLRFIANIPEFHTRGK